MSTNNERNIKKGINPAVLIAEDDPDQKDLLIDIALNQIKTALSDESLTELQREKLVNLKVFYVSDLDSLKKAVKNHQNIILAVLDCNMPDTKDSAPHDQFVKTNHKITGQHKAVDIVARYLPNKPITMISSLNRFHTIIRSHYKNKLNKDINFVNKTDPSKLERNIRYYIKQYLKSF